MLRWDAICSKRCVRFATWTSSASSSVDSSRRTRASTWTWSSRRPWSRCATAGRTCKWKTTRRFKCIGRSSSSHDPSAPGTCRCRSIIGCDSGRIWCAISRRVSSRYTSSVVRWTRTRELRAIARADRRSIGIGIPTSVVKWPIFINKRSPPVWSPRKVRELIFQTFSFIFVFILNSKIKIIDFRELL